MPSGEEVITCNRCGKEVKRKNAHPTEIVLFQPTCKSCGEYREKCRRIAYQRYKDSISGYSDIEPKSIDEAAHMGYLSRFLPDDYRRK